MREPGPFNFDSADGKGGVHAEKSRGILRGKYLWFAAAASAVALASLGALAVANSREAKLADSASVNPPARNLMFPVTINRPQGARMVATSTTNFLGQQVMVSCSSCHTTTKPNIENRHSQDLDQFHQGLQISHGNLNCLSCHDAADYEGLRLADGRHLGFEDSMNLCSQCHGPQRRDYDIGLHGGMNGHWDLSKGGRVRNTCINCHDPHSPAFPMVMPVLPPHDRVSVRAQNGHGANKNSSHP